MYIAMYALFCWLMHLSIYLTADALPGTCLPWGALIMLALLVLAVSVGLIPLLKFYTRDCKLYKSIHVSNKSGCTTQKQCNASHTQIYSLSRTGNAMYGTNINSFHAQLVIKATKKNNTF